MSRQDNGFLFSLLLMKKIEADKRRKKEQWRKNAVDGDYYDIDPQEYESEEEYLSALEDQYGWRDYYRGDWRTVRIDPDDYETEDEYLEAREALLEEEDWE